LAVKTKGVYKSRVEKVFVKQLEAFQDDILTRMSKSVFEADDGYGVMKKIPLTRAMLAAKSNLSAGTVHRLLDGDTLFIRLLTLQKIYLALGCELRPVGYKKIAEYRVISISRHRMRQLERDLEREAISKRTAA
jgi:DNA-binding Xre family transcriptional regulator